MVKVLSVLTHFQTLLKLSDTVSVFKLQQIPSHGPGEWKCARTRHIIIMYILSKCVNMKKCI